MKIFATANVIDDRQILCHYVGLVDAKTELNAGFVKSAIACLGWDNETLREKLVDVLNDYNFAVDQAPNVYRVAIVTYHDGRDQHLHLNLDFGSAASALAFFESYRTDEKLRADVAQAFRRSFNAAKGDSNVQS